MNRRRYSEDQSVQKPAAELLASMGWGSVVAFNDEDFGPHSLLGRSNKTEWVLRRHLRAALVRLNPGVPALAVDHAMDALLALDAAKTLVQINEDKYKLLRDGVPVQVRWPDGRETSEKLAVIDFDRPDDATRNEFICVQELWLEGGPAPIRPDLLLFVNGLPLVCVEFKRQDKDLKVAFDDNYTRYREDLPALFAFNALVVLSDGFDARFGTLTSPWEHYYRWKRLNETDPDPAPKDDEVPVHPVLPLLLRGMCLPATLLDLVENFTLFDRSEGEPLKIMARNHQYMGVNRVIAKLRAGVECGKLGVFWHTQGSGKSYSMVFFAQKVRRKVSASYSFVLMTDRDELDKQIHGTFVNCGVVVNVRARARDGNGLKRLLTEDNSYVFSLIHKFHRRVGDPWSERRDVIVISDEAHRTQYGRLATRMREALPHAKFIGFTGTPLMENAEDQRTRQVFGVYVSVYDFQRAVADGATVPLSYEPHGEKLKIVDEAINQRVKERIDTLAAEGELTDEQEEKLYKELNTEGFVLTLPSRLQKVADDFVRHFSDRWRLMNGRSKALMVCLDKRTCVQMHGLIATAWKKRADDLHAAALAEMARYTALGKAPDEFLVDQQRKVDWMRETEMCVVVSQSPTERADFDAWGLDIRPHRDKMNRRELEADFKKPEHPFRVAIVCAMWLTGFDVKPLATLYLDKPMQGHTLMQAIARVNRRAPGKKNGLIIDYNGMLKSLRAALATFAQKRDAGLGDAEVDPLREPEQGMELEYAASIARVRAHLLEHGYALQDLVDAQARDFEISTQLHKAREALSETAEVKKTFEVLAQDVEERRLNLFPHECLARHSAEEAAIAAIYNLLQKRGPPIDVVQVLRGLQTVVDSALALQPQAQVRSGSYDLSAIDFVRLQSEFAQTAYKQTEVLSLQEKIEARLLAMLQKNPTRVNLYERYQQIVAEYNRDKDAAEIQRVFEELARLNDELNIEDQQYIAEGFENEDQRAIYQLLCKEKTDLTPADIKKIKAVAKELLAKLLSARNQLQYLRDRAALQAQMRTEIFDYLFDQLPEGAYGQDEILGRSQRVFEHFYRRQIDGLTVH
jgi:type I restriction enzyme, R subunit